jgi:hypothetical protein
MESGVDMASCGVIYMPSFIKIDAGVQAILRFCLRCCNVGITDGGIYELRR